MDLRKRPSADTKLVARYAISTFGAPPSVWRFTCEPEGLSVDIGGCADRPMAGVLSYTTIGLSDYDLALGPEPGKGDSPHLPERPVGCCAQMGTVPFSARVELAAACASDRPQFPNILAAAAMLLIRRQGEVKPGDSLRDVIADFYPRATVSHLYLSQPFLWDQRLKRLQGAEKSIAWLLAVPVTSGELLHLETQGDAGLEELYRQRRIDMYSLGRATWLT
jgi:hypothetical protein